MLGPTGSINVREMLKAKDLRLSFNEIPVIREASLVVRPGESVAITGPSGCGKTTLLKVLAGLLAPDSGSVQLGDVRLDDLPERTRRRLRLRHFGFVFQFGELIPELSAIENVMLPGRLLGDDFDEMNERALSIMTALGIAHKTKAKVTELSGGEIQRVGIARAVCLQPDFVFADEPTGSLDEANTRVAIELLFDAVKSSGSGLVLVTHDPSVAQNAHRVARMEYGVLQF